ncbi:MAG: sugar phosphate isomerase/epimerase [Clostridia bacterium]|nr:sugar phosphate isomerase/epimerase [Clostridia bacterium]
MKKLLIQSVSNDDINANLKESLLAIKNAKFDGVFLQWYDGDYKKFEISCKKQAKLAKKLGLSIEFAHLSYKNINNIWLEGKVGDKTLKQYFKAIKQIKSVGINFAIMHLTATEHTPKFNGLGIERLQTLCNYAEKLGVKIAFENTRKKGYLEYVMENIKNKNVGVCFDSGHAHCHFKDDFDFAIFKNRIFAVHLHDNHGEKDEHLLPFDGTINWQKVIAGLKLANYTGPITLESGYSEHYKEMDVNAFYKKSYQQAKRIREMLNKEKTNERK